jgi:hypothetical protein
MSFETSEIDGSILVRDLEGHTGAPLEISARATRNEHSCGFGYGGAGMVRTEQRLPFMHHLEKKGCSNWCCSNWLTRLELGHKLPQLFFCLFEGLGYAHILTRLFLLEPMHVGTVKSGASVPDARFHQCECRRYA